MASKRTFNEEDHEGNNDRDLQVPAKKRHGDSQQAEAMNLSVLDPEFLTHIRKVMEEVIPPMLQRYIPPCCCRLSQKQEGATSGGRAMQLCFVNSLPEKIYTSANLRAEKDVPLQIELRDAASQQRVVTEKYSTMMVQICVLHGDFGTDANEDWTAEEFDFQIVKPREGKPAALLKGETVIKLEKGVAFIDNEIEFTDNSSHTTTKKFRLGVKIEKSNNFVGTDIREGISKPFKVLDKRGEKYKKHDRPALDDEVWRLNNISKGGPLHLQLSDNGIISVKDLLRFNTTGSLRGKFGNTNAWDKIVKHAKNCKLDDDERYIYHAMEKSPSLVFNCIYEVVEVKFSGQNYRSLQSLSSEEKRLVERVKQVAYQNLKDLVPIETAPHDIVKTLADTQVAPYGAPDPGLQLLLLNAQQVQPVQLPDSSQPFCTNQRVHDPLPGEREIGQNSHVLDGIFSERNSWPLDGSNFPWVLGGCSIENESLQNQFTYCCPPFATLESDTDFMFDSSVGAEFGSYSWNPNSKAVWNKIHKIRVALKWVILVKREAAARKVLTCVY